MKSRISIHKILFCLVLIVTSGAIISANADKTYAAQDTCTWTGAINSDMSNAGNWTGCDNGNVPEAGDDLRFDNSATNFNVNANVSTIFRDIYIDDSSYVFTAGELRLSRNLNVFASAEINSDIEFVNSTGQSMLNVQEGAPIINGVIDLDITGTGFFVVTTDNGSFTVPELTGSTTSILFTPAASADVTFTSNPTPATYTATTVVVDKSDFVCNNNNCFGSSANNVTINEDAVRSSNIDFLAATPLTIANNITMGGTGGLFHSFNVRSDMTLSGNLTVGSNSLSLYVRGPAVDFVHTGTLQINSGIVFDIQGTNDYTTSFTKSTNPITGSGTIRFHDLDVFLDVNSPSFDGEIVVSGGTVAEINGPQSLGTTTGTTNVFAGGVLVVNGGTDYSVAETITIAGTGSRGYTAALINNGSGLHTWAGNIILNGNTAIHNASLLEKFYVSGVISGTGNLGLSSSTTVNESIEFSGSASNTYIGNTTVNGGGIFLARTGGAVVITGNLTVNALPSLGAYVTLFGSNNISDTSNVNLVGNGANVASFAMINDTEETIASLSGNSSSRLRLGSNTELTLQQSANTSFLGAIEQIVGTSIINKNLNGNLVLGGSYVGSSTPGSLLLLIDGNAAVEINGNYANMDVRTVSPSTPTILGSGTINDLMMLPGARLTPGNSPGCISAGSTDLVGTTFIVEIEGASPCTGYDRLTADDVMLNGSYLNIQLTYSPVIGTVFTIIATSNPIVGIFYNLDDVALNDGDIIIVDGVSFRINYTGNNVTLTAVGGSLASTGSVTSVAIVLFAAVVSSISLAVIIRERKLVV